MPCTALQHDTDAVPATNQLPATEELYGYLPVAGMQGVEVHRARAVGLQLAMRSACCCDNTMHIYQHAVDTFLIHHDGNTGRLHCHWTVCKDNASPMQVTTAQHNQKVHM
jgi:hypothetical protein